MATQSRGDGCNTTGDAVPGRPRGCTDMESALQRISLFMFCGIAIAGCGSSPARTNLGSSTTTQGPATTEVATTPTSATAAPGTPPPPKRPKPYHRPGSFYIDAHASVAGSDIRVDGTTNLPDGSVLTINAERAFKQTHEDERIDFLGQNGPSVDHAFVHQGQFSGEVSSVEQNLPELMRGDPGGPVATLDPDADVCVIFYTGRDEAVNGPWQQDSRVRTDVGNFGNYLHGSPNVGVFGSLTKSPSLYILVPQRVPLNASVMVGKLAAQQTITPQLAPLPDVCGP